MSGEVFERNPPKTAAETLASMLSPASVNFEATQGGRPALMRQEYAAMLAGLSTVAETAFRARYMLEERAGDMLAMWTSRKAWPDWPRNAKPDSNICTRLHNRLSRAAVEEYAAGKPLPAVQIRKIARISPQRWPELVGHFKHMVSLLHQIDDELRAHLAVQFKGKC